MSYELAYTTRCPRCAEKGGDNKGNNLAVYKHGTSYCYACKEFIDTPDNHNNISFLDKKREDVGFHDDLKVTEILVGEGDIADKDVIRFLWQFELYRDDWKRHGLKQCFGSYTKTKEDKEGKKVSILPTSGITVPTYGGYIIRQLARQPKVIRSHNSDHWSYSMETDLPLVIVEDVFSGMKVAKAGYGVLALCGTTVNQWAQYYLARHTVDGRKVFIWLDRDEAGKVGTKKVQKILTMYCTPSIICTMKDPKWYAVEEIQEILK